MTDFDFDVKEKKKLARMGSYRKRGSKSKQCNLPSDKLTKKQWERRNGVVYSYNKGEPMSWKSFVSLPNDMQADYINHLIQKYNVNISSLADMFLVSSPTVRKYVGVLSPRVEFIAGKRMSSQEKDLWVDFISREKLSAHVDTPNPSPTPSEDQLEADSEQMSQNDGESVLSPIIDSSQLTQFSMVFEGVVDINKITNSIRATMGGGLVGKVEVSFSLQAI